MLQARALPIPSYFACRTWQSEYRYYRQQDCGALLRRGGMLRPAHIKSTAIKKAESKESARSRYHPCVFRLFTSPPATLSVHIVKSVHSNYGSRE